MKTHSCFRLLTNALTGAILFTTTALQAEEADHVKVTDLMAKDLVNFTGKEGNHVHRGLSARRRRPRASPQRECFRLCSGRVDRDADAREEKVTLHPGDTFYEDPAGIHLVGKNASDTKPAKFLVFLVKDKGAPLLIPVNEASEAGNQEITAELVRIYIKEQALSEAKSKKDPSKQ